MLEEIFTAEGIIANLEAMRDRPDQSDLLKSMECPVLYFFIIGKNDTAVPFEYSLNQTYLPKKSLIQILPNIGHMGMGMFEGTKKNKEGDQSIFRILS